VARRFLALVVIAIPLTFAACGGDDETSTSAASGDETSTEASTTTVSSAAAGGGGTVKIGETEFKLNPSDPTTKAGQVTFDVSNDGSTTHNLEVEGNGVEEETEDLQPGQSGKLIVDLKPGSYEIYCAIDDHKDLGMEGTLTVQ
jgi:uncharacterized cupredoxin-like copper-binding protein